MNDGGDGGSRGQRADDEGGGGGGGVEVAIEDMKGTCKKFD